MSGTKNIFINLMLIFMVFYFITAVSMDIDHWLNPSKESGDHYWINFLINAWILHVLGFKWSPNE